MPMREVASAPEAPVPARACTGKARPRAPAPAWHGGFVALHKGCQAAIAAFVGCSEESAQLHRLPASEDWLRTAAILFAGAYARDSELLALQTQRVVDVRRDIQESSALGTIPPHSSLYHDRLGQLRAELAAMRSRHGDAAVTRCMLKAEAREVAELPEGFHVNEEPSTDNPPPSNRHGHWYRATVPGLSGTLHDNAVYPLHIPLSTIVTQIHQLIHTINIGTNCSS